MTDGQRAYREFLSTDFWKEISAEKRRLVGKCEKCGSTRKLQAHHVRYPSNWFDTKLDDLQVLCRIHHEVEHFGERSFLPNGRPWDEQWLLDLTHRLNLRLQSGFKLKQSQASVLINLARKYGKDSCLRFHIRNVFRLSHLDMGDYKNPHSMQQFRGR